MLLNHEKQTRTYNHYAQLPLTARPLDLLYFIFFAVSHDYYHTLFTNLRPRIRYDPLSHTGSC